MLVCPARIAARRIASRSGVCPCSGPASHSPACWLSCHEPVSEPHSAAGCIFYGAFVTKMLSLSRRGMPGWLLPVTGGLTFTALIVLWLTSALWVFGTQGLHF